MDTPLVSAIIPTYNRAWCLPQALESVFNQDYPNLELIVVDDGSEDGSQDLLIPLAQQGRLTLITQSNRGVSAARNAGLKQARGEFVAFLDSDDLWLPEKISAQIEYFKKNPQALLVQTQETWIRKGRRVNPRQRHLKKEGDIFLESLELCLISPSAVMLRPALFKEVGGFDEELLAAEDYDLWLRVLLHHPVGLVDRELVIRQGGRPDQLSAGHSLDRWRIKALTKIIPQLSGERLLKAQAELERRRKIYHTGLAKRQSA